MQPVAAAALRPVALMLAAGEVVPSCAHTPLILAEDDGEEEEDGDGDEEEESGRAPLVLAFAQLSGEGALPAGVISAGSEPRSVPALCCC